MTINYQNLNTIKYIEALDLQNSAYRKVKESKRPKDGYLFLLEHYPVITNGRFADNSNFVLPTTQIEKLGVEVHNSDRGGDLTYHGPGQLVSYPILDLRTFKIGVKAYIESLEQVIINLLTDFGIESDRRDGYPGVWTNGQKIASIGVSVKNGITMHGSALNVSTDLDAFSMIVPCGISNVVVTSMEKTLGEKIPMDKVKKKYVDQFYKIFDSNLTVIR